MQIHLKLCKKRVLPLTFTRLTSENDLNCTQTCHKSDFVGVSGLRKGGLPLAPHPTHTLHLLR